MKGYIELSEQKQIAARVLSLIGTCMLLSLLVALMGCDDDSTSSGDNLNVIEFPNAIGSHWIYYVYDSLVEAGDTVDVRITGFTTLPDGGGQAKVWTFSYRNWTSETGGARVDTEYVQTIGDTIKIHRPHMPELVTILQTWWVGRTWTSGAGHIDTTTMVAVHDQRYTPLGIVPNVLEIERDWRTSDVGENSTLFLAPNIGLIVKHYQRFSLPPDDSLSVNELWAVMSYSSGEN